jgi:hypothetical protein
VSELAERSRHEGWAGLPLYRGDGDRAVACPARAARSLGLLVKTTGSDAALAYAATMGSVAEIAAARPVAVRNRAASRAQASVTSRICAFVLDRARYMDASVNNLNPYLPISFSTISPALAKESLTVSASTAMSSGSEC